MKATQNDIKNGLQYYNQYITEVPEVEKILLEKRFELNYTGLKNDRYNYIFKINGIRFNYFEGIGNDRLNNENAPEKIINSLWCLLIDDTYYNYDIDDFFHELGYEKVSEVINTLKAISKNHDKLLMCFTPEELETLKDNIQL